MSSIIARCVATELSFSACSFCSLACTSRLFDPWAVGTRGLLSLSSDPHYPLPSMHSVQSVQARGVQLTATRHTCLRVPSHPHVERVASSPAAWHRCLRRCLALSSLHTRTASAASNTLPGRREAMRLSFSFSFFSETCMGDKTAQNCRLRSQASSANFIRFLRRLHA